MRGVSFDVRAGEVVVIIGPSGCGKSTALRSLNRMNDLIEKCRVTGRILLEQRDIYSPETDVAGLRRRVGMVFQHLALIPDLSVAENLLLPLIPRKRSWADMQADVGRQLTAADLAAQAAKPARALSGGQRQRVALGAVQHAVEFFGGQREAAFARGLDRAVG